MDYNKPEKIIRVVKKKEDKIKYREQITDEYV